MVSLHLMMQLVVLLFLCVCSASTMVDAAAFVAVPSSGNPLATRPQNKIRGVGIRGGTRMTGNNSCLFAAPKKTATAKKTTATKSADLKESVETFRKADFVSSVQEMTGLSKVDSEAALNAVLDTITSQVAEGKRISLVGFGTFKLSARAARKGRNPQTGQEIDIAASNSPSFSASKAFKEKCNP